MTALKQTILQGWPEERSHVPPLVHPYYARIEELAVYDGIVYGRNRFPGRTRCCTSQPEEHPKRENPFVTPRNRWMSTQSKRMPILAEHDRRHQRLHISVDYLADAGGQTIIGKLKAHCARYGIPDTIVFLTN